MPAPLNTTGMFWSWQSGFRFLQVNMEPAMAAADGSTQIQKMAWTDIPPGGTVLLTQGEMRGRIEGVSQPRFEGGQLDGTFVFEKRGRFRIFFLVDPVEAVEGKGVETVSDDVDRAKSTTEIAAASRRELGADAAVLPLAIVGDVAIVGWIHGKTPRGPSCADSMKVGRSSCGRDQA